MALTDGAAVKAYANEPNLDSSRDAELTRCINAATDWIKAEANWLIEATTATIVTLNGDDACGTNNEMLFLPTKYRPVVYPTGFGVTEDGVSLTHSAAYSTTVQVFVDGSGTERQCALIRRDGTWASGIGNIVATINSGYSSGSIPPRIVQLCCEVAWRMFTSGSRDGASSISMSGSSVAWESTLSDTARATLAMLRRRA